MKTINLHIIHGLLLRYTLHLRLQHGGTVHLDQISSWMQWRPVHCLTSQIQGNRTHWKRELPKSNYKSAVHIEPTETWNVINL